MTGLSGRAGLSGLREFTPVGRAPVRLLRKAYMRLGYGYRRTERRIWVNPDASSPILVNLEVERLHCPRDVAALLEGGSLSPELMTAFDDLHLRVTDEASGTRIMRWNLNDFTCSLRRIARGSSLIDILTMTRSEQAASIADDLAAETVEWFDEDAGGPLCLGFTWRQLWGLAIAVPLIVIPIFGTGMAAYAIAPDPVAILAIIVAGIATVLAHGVWNRRRRFKYLSKIWRQIFTQGDNDGSVRRALGSIGVTIPPP